MPLNNIFQAHFANMRNGFDGFFHIAPNDERDCHKSVSREKNPVFFHQNLDAIRRVTGRSEDLQLFLADAQINAPLREGNLGSYDAYIAQEGVFLSGFFQGREALGEH